MMTRSLLLILVAFLTFCQSGPAWAQKTWPTDSAGRPAPPCVIYDPVANTTTFCSTSLGAGLPVSVQQTGGVQTDPTGYGKQMFLATAPSPSGVTVIGEIAATGGG